VGAWARFDLARGARHGRDGCGGGDGSDRQGPRGSESGCARARNDADGAVPLGRERRRASERDAAQTGGADRSADARAGGGGGRLAGPKGRGGRGFGLLFLFFYSDFSNSLSFCFSLLDSNSNMLQIQIQIVQTCASNKNNNLVSA
jgi:hypothetical protein